MRAIVVAALLITACRGHRGEHASHDDPGTSPPGKPAAAASASAIVPQLPPSEDGAAALHVLDGRIERHRKHTDDERATIELLLDRAGLVGDVEDYVDALALSKTWTDRAPRDPDAWKFRARVLSRVHRFADARAALAHVETLAPKDNELVALTATIDEATGHLDRSAPVRERAAAEWPEPIRLMQWATSVALQGRLDDAILIMRRSATAVRDNPPELLELVLFQLGRMYEQKGELAAARELFAAARARMPALEPTAHLIQAMIATGDTAGAKPIAAAALATSRQPDLVALAAQLETEPTQREALRAEAKAAWERYVAALPEAFADHAARFYLGVGADPARAEVLAKLNLDNRDTTEARALFVDAALAAKDTAGACDAAGSLLARTALRSQRFIAWRAYVACGRQADADQLAQALGIR
jgi:hypothetical protein